MNSHPYDDKTVARFWAKVNKDGPEHPHDKSLGKCWLWMGAHLPHGYGVFSKSTKNKTINGYAHRFSYEYHKGAIAGLEVCHSCDVRDCVNPAHLWLGTRKQNANDAWVKHRILVPVGKPFRRGEAHPQCKLSNADIDSIKQMVTANSQSAVARRFGISQAYVSRIASGKRR